MTRWDEAAERSRITTWRDEDRVHVAKVREVGWTPRDRRERASFSLMGDEEDMVW